MDLTSLEKEPLLQRTRDYALAHGLDQDEWSRLLHPVSYLPSNEAKDLAGWSLLLYYYDAELFGHSLRVGVYAALLSKRLHQNYERVFAAGLLHDLGKMHLPAEILQKPGALTEEEREYVKAHPVFGHALLSRHFQSRTILDAALYHHRWWNGDEGYPHATTPRVFSTALITIADVYDAVTSNRPYRQAWSTDKALGLLFEGRGTQFHPEGVDRFSLLAQADVPLGA